MSSSTVLAVQILERLLAHASLKDNIQFGHIPALHRPDHKTWLEIVPPEKPRPVFTPAHFVDFLASVLALDPTVIQLIWHGFSDLAEASYLDPKKLSVDDNFKQHGHANELGAETIVPPMSYCLRPSCNSAHLSEKRIVEARLIHCGAAFCPFFYKSLYCRGCHTRYYHNYFVQEAHNVTAQREYYKPVSPETAPSIPNYIHVFESCYVEQALCVFFESQLSMSHTPCQAIARVYNSALAHTSNDPSGSRLKDELVGDLVLESFFLHAILRDKADRGEPLALPHHGYQNHGYDEVLAERNYRMVAREECGPTPAIVAPKYTKARMEIGIACLAGSMMVLPSVMSPVASMTVMRQSSLSVISFAIHTGTL
ncbi:hypothetical protein B0H17DRAFT_1153591 [Mycena rosella]|uniref:CxC5 like cysteine cluster associated with KDZ domain-containing protein n=1 Tax=Mycena rosella TaxID=1033263 RepID=A0AAD7B4P3_MYCRO|nr:hypothetical protein B0H17DRAFT_1153591 [Mycena rosella]